MARVSLHLFLWMVTIEEVMEHLRTFDAFHRLKKPSESTECGTVSVMYVNDFCG